MNDWRSIALGVTLTLLSIGTTWAFTRLVRWVRYVFMSYALLKHDVAGLKAQQYSMKAKLLDYEFKSLTSIHTVSEYPPPLPTVSEVGWEDDEDETAAQSSQ